MKTNNIYTAWQFVEQYYPNYQQSPMITYIDDLTKIINMENEDGDNSDAHFKLMYDSDYNNPRIMQDYNEALVDVYERAIENYLHVSKAIDQVNSIINP